MKQAIALFRKDLASEIRTRYAINSLLMFIIVTISVILYAIGQEKISDYLTGGLLWVIVFFTAMSGLSRTFVSEEERGTVMALQLSATPDTVLSGKFLFNLVLMFSMNIIILVLYSLLFEAFVLKNLSLFLAAYLLGNIGIASASTVIAAIISKAGSKGTLYPVLAFPILLPLMLTLIETTKMSMDGTPFDESLVELAVLGSYNVVMIAASYLLFDIIWKD
ncbi:MAG: heme exporter protein CcmB [Ignavibacteriaceae bacterium]|nr:heme exporter protein CcmB [Ignavibacteriaceae bacterium]